MKTFLSAVVILFTSSTPIAAVTNDNEQCAPNVPDYTFDGKRYKFQRLQYNTVCLDSSEREYQWGKVEGVWPPIDEPDGGGCSSVCISGYGRGHARGCTDMQPDKLVGYNYNCDEGACYCLYEKGAWSGNSSPCFDSMNTSNEGQGSVAKGKTSPGSTCYRINVQPAPAPAPEPRVRDICTGKLDYECYKTGRPACCSSDEFECPDYKTMCDNIPEHYVGWSYCAGIPPDNDCYPKSNGRPSCCRAPGGDLMNCPIDMPDCETGVETAHGVAANDIVKFLRGN